MPKTNYAENSILNTVFRGVAFPTLPASMYIAAYSVIPGEDGTGGTEITGAGYARVAVSRAAGSWKDPSTATQGQVDNTAEIAFPVATGDYPAAVVAVGVLDDPTAGNLWYRGNLTASRTILTGGQLKFNANQLVVAEG